MNKLKAFAKIILRIVNIVSEQVMSLISLFRLPVRVKKIHNRIIKKIKKEPVNVGLIVQFPEMWNSIKSVYFALIEDARFNVTVIAIPKLFSASFFHKNFSDINDAGRFFEKEGIKCLSIDPLNDSYKFILSKLDYIFLQRPYDSYMPNELSQYKLSKSSILCYIPYGYEFVTGVHLNIEYNNSMLNNIGIIFADNSETAEYCIKKSKSMIAMGARKIYDIGYPRFDLIKQFNYELHEQKVFLWLPRWSLSDKNDKSHFMDYYQKLIVFFENNPKLKLIIRPHPLMFDNFIHSGALTENDVINIKNFVNKMDNVSFDYNKNYLQTFEISDCLIADFTSLIIEYFASGKPIIYCGSTENFNIVGKKMAECLYLANDWTELLREISKIIDGNDRCYEKRRQSAMDLFYNNSTIIADKIVEEIYNDSAGKVLDRDSNIF